MADDPLAMELELLSGIFPGVLPYGEAACYLAGRNRLSQKLSFQLCVRNLFRMTIAEPDSTIFGATSHKNNALINAVRCLPSKLAFPDCVT